MGLECHVGPGDIGGTGVKMETGKTGGSGAT